MTQAGEFALIAGLQRLLTPPGGAVKIAAGDDAAVVRVGGREVAIAVDAVVADVHFRRDLSSLSDVGWKAVAINVSDMAAMGATPTTAVVGLGRPAGMSFADVELLYEGMAQACARWDVALVGGDTVAADTLWVCVTVLGDVGPQAAVSRAGAQPGDAIVVVGALGAAAAALALDAAGRPADQTLLAAHRRPQALVAAGRVLAEHGALAMIDVSDGLGADLSHICRASGIGARLDATLLPVAPGVIQAAEAAGVDVWDLVCGGGEDFALCAALPADRAAGAAVTAGAAEGVLAAVVGHVVAADEGPLVALELADGAVRDVSLAGFDHYWKA